MDVEKLFKGEGGYVFVSHSHLDIETVRQVRNFLEERGLEPILFFLKSLDDAAAEKKQFLRTLIYDEINAREFFLYLDSPNAQKSKWVQEEIAYVTQNSPEKVYAIKLENGLEYLKKELEAFTKKMRVFISCAYSDGDIFTRLKEKLIKCDFRVYDADEKISANGNIFSARATIKDVSKEGMVIVLLTKNSIRSKFVYQEVKEAIFAGGNVLPVIIEEELSLEDMPPQWGFLLCDKQHLILKNSEDEEMEKIVEVLLEKRFK
ncbi:MAG: toll/interleukin-1 receptor domain-containing protein [Clostridia bacterium]|nr:toll/interleukin-1 receptor domain-containing protein [Clostridia bacterium]